MMQFINRKGEIEFLEKKFKSKEAELIILYGRRRIGKTELILNFCKSKENVYFMGRLESREDTIKRFNNLLIEKFSDTKLLNSPISNWDGLFDYISEKIEKRTIFVFDEFPFVAERFPEIISLLQDKWDSSLKKNHNLMIILCGSSISMMEKYALDYKSPLYGRRTGQWKVEKMDIAYLKDFFPSYDIGDIIRLYSCLDVIPGYLTRFSPDKSLLDNLREKMFSKGEFLYEEVEILLREEFRDPSNYMSIISSLAGGLTTFNEIYNKTNLDKSLLSKYLHTLENLSIIERIIPVTESYKTKLKFKGALYSLKDNFFDFWFRFVYLNKQELEKGYSKQVLENIKPEMEQYVSKKFEKFIGELISLGNVWKFNKIGKWWHKDEEIDIVAINEKEDKILFGECKWRENIGAPEIVKKLREKSESVDWRKGKRKEVYAVFAKSFKRKITSFEGMKVHCFDLNDIDKLLAK